RNIHFNLYSIYEKRAFVKVKRRFLRALCGVTLKAEKTITVFLLYFFIRTAKGGLQNGRIFVLDVRPAPQDRSTLQRRGAGGGYCREDRKKRRRYLRRA